MAIAAHRDAVDGVVEWGKVEEPRDPICGETRKATATVCSCAEGVPGEANARAKHRMRNAKGTHLYALSVREKTGSQQV
eukprot:4518813-Pleurochrysis_carterae.AAC.2